MNILSLENVGKSFGLGPLFERVTFGLEHADRVGLIGRNGTGKTTLLRIIAGVEGPDEGRVSIANGTRIVYVAQNPRFPAGATVLDALFPPTTPEMRMLREYEDACQRLATAGADSGPLLARVSELSARLEAEGVWALETAARSALTRLGVRDTSALVENLSGGERRRVALASALIVRPDLLVLDEPTNHLDADTVAWLEQELERYSGALVIVTHDRYFLDRVTHRILEIDGATVQAFDGSYSYYLVKKAEMEVARAAAESRRATQLRRELEWLERGAKARTTKQKARIDRAQELMEGAPAARRGELDVSAASSRLGKKILSFDGVGKAFGSREIVRDFTYTLKRGDRIGVVGPNGAGKSTLLDLVAGRLLPDAGAIDRGETVVLGYFDQESRALDDEKRVIDYVREAGERLGTASGDTITAGQMLERFLFPPEAQYSPIAKLSGGERRRLFLLRVLMTAPNVLLLDEPTNDFDIQTLEALESYLDSFDGCLVVVSHDRFFLDRTVDHVFAMPGDGTVRQYAGNYSAFVAAREVEAASEKLEPAVPRPRREEQPKERSQKLSFKERREYEELEARIDQAERRRAEVSRELATASSDFARVQALYEEQQTLDEQLERDITRWGELAERA